MRVGEVVTAPGKVVLNAGLPVTRLRVRNTADHVVQVSSHYHFFEVNPRLAFNRAEAYGMRLNVPAGSSVRWRPGQEREVELVSFAGRLEIHGFWGAVEGPIAPENREGSLRRAAELGLLLQEV